jgi:hypothetical protein
MQWVGKLSLRHKITYVIMINTFAALCVASIAFAEYGVYRFKQMQMPVRFFRRFRQSRTS